MVDVSIIIVNYNTKILLEACLYSIYEQTKLISFEIIVSDNGSSDGSLSMLEEKFPQVIRIDNKANLGFGAANNRALAKASGKYILYLNSDTILLNNAVKIFFDYWENADNKDAIGALGCNLLNEKGQTIHSGGDFPTAGTEIVQNFLELFYVLKNSIPIIRHTHLGFANDIKPRHVGSIDYVTGADLFVKNDSFASFDERYFLYYEDTDLQKRMSLEGKERLLIDGPLIRHLKGMSDKSPSVLSFYRSIPKIHTQLSACKFLRKYRASRVKIFILKMIILLIWINPLLIRKTHSYISKLFAI